MQDKEIKALYSRAESRARQRLVARHRSEWRELNAEECVRLNIPIKESRLTRDEVESLRANLPASIKL
jgi:hypothetical protein